MSELLKVENLGVAYGDLQVLHDIHIRVDTGEIVAVLGSNGAGKTTLLQAISGLLPLRQGRVIFDSRELTRIPAHELPSLGMAHVPQGRGIFTTLTVMENLTIGAWNPRGKKERERHLNQVFDLFPRLKERTSQMAATLSGGEQQMLAMGRALMSNPALLLLDEPSLGLAPLVVRALFQIIQDINERQMTIFLVEQNASQALHVAHRGYVMETGKIVLTGPREALLNDDKVKQAYLGT